MTLQMTLRETLICPSCGQALAQSGELLQCATPECGEDRPFFTYGPNMVLVRMPFEDDSGTNGVLPWE